MDGGGGGSFRSYHRDSPAVVTEFYLRRHPQKQVSEYELYFNWYLRQHPEKTRVRHAAWCNARSPSLLAKGHRYDFVSFHDTFIRAGCAAFCCCGVDEGGGVA